MPDKKIDPGEYINPAATNARREAEAEDDGKKGRDMGDLPGPTMSQWQFGKAGKKPSPPDAMLKKRASKE